MRAVEVRREDAEKARLELLGTGLCDKDRLIRAKDDHVEIPVLTAPETLGVRYKLVEQQHPSFKPPPLNFREMKRYLRGYIGAEAELLKGGWELIGDVMIISLPQKLYPHRETIGEALLDFHPRAGSVVVRGSITDPLRKPQAEVVAGGEETRTIHRENGVKFALDPREVMFSGGNVSERERMAHISSGEEKVLDMFAGVGQFSLPMALHSSPRKVVAVEKRRQTWAFLKENVRLNNLDNVEAILGDNREVSPGNFAHRVIMGYFFSPQEYLPMAVEALRGKGTIHYHALVEKPELDSLGGSLVGLVEGLGREARVAYRRIVKSYAPLRWHAVYDLEVG